MAMKILKKCNGLKKLTTKIHPTLPIDFSKAVLQDGRQNLVFGLSFGLYHGMTIDDELKKNRHSSESFVKNCKGHEMSPPNYTCRCLLLLAHWWCGVGGIIQSVGLVSAVLVVGPQLFNRKNRDVA